MAPAKTRHFCNTSVCGTLCSELVEKCHVKLSPTLENSGERQRDKQHIELLLHQCPDTYRLISQGLLQDEGPVIQ